MPKQSFFCPGQTIVLREIWDGKIWSARPVIVVQDRPDLTALYLPQGTSVRLPVTLKGERTTPHNRARAEWILKEELWDRYHHLRLTIPGANYSVLLFLHAQDMSHDIWYINMEDPLRRTEHGFKYMDQFLDIFIKSDLSSWHWKDEDELEEAIALGLISKERAAAMRAEGEKVARWIQSGRSPFNAWEKWRPDPAWQAPLLPEGWDRV
jgi:predicted RNA-binding protein associated with RNAse of E/G family